MNTRHACLVLAFGCLACLLAVPAGAGAPTLIARWGGTWGTSPGHFQSPAGVALDGAGYAYVVDASGRVQKFTTSGTFVTQWGSFGSGPGQFWYPSGIAADRAGFVYIADRANCRIQKYTTAGAFVAVWGTYGTGPLQLNGPYDIAVDPSGTLLYVADSGNNRVVEYTTGGTYVRQWSGLNQPEGVAVSPAGHVFVADWYAARIQEFTATGAFLACRGQSCSGPCSFNYPNSVCTDPAGNVYVLDSSNAAVQEISEAGAYLGAWGPWSPSFAEPVSYPSRMTIDPDTGDYYVANGPYNCVQVFSDQATPAQASSWSRIKSLYR